MAVGPPRLARRLSPALVVGASGQVGGALWRTLPQAVGTYRSRPGPGLQQLDAADTDALRRIVDSTGAETVFFPAAHPNVDWCEAHPAEAEARNLDPLRAALMVARERSLFLVAYSSDYVFDGAAGPYAEDATVSPISVYGRIKVALEELALAAGAAVVRSTGIFGWERGEPRNFVLRLVRALGRGEAVRVPSDQISTPTYADDLARASGLIAEAREPGIWHVAGPDLVSRVELARRAADAFGLSRDLIEPVSTASLGQLARRPLLGGLLTERLRARFGFAARSVNAALEDLRGKIKRDE